ncbi:MAG: ABC transporter permease [Clostridia bacterium]|nr:ABC transporter permease [Clostridia bacterium]
MYIFKNAIVSITRNVGRNVLIGIIILVIACACSVTLAIRNSADSLIESYENKYDVIATLGMNREKMMGNFNPQDRESSKENMINKFNEISSITSEDVINYGTSEYVKSYYYTESIGVNATDIETVSASFNTGAEGQNNQMQMPGGDRTGMQQRGTQTSGDFTLTGYSSYESMEDFISGSYTITEGEVSSDFTSNSCVINSELATLNEIVVGDVITVTNPEDETQTYELKVTGIYTDNTESQNSRMNMFSNSANTIITNATTIENIVAQSTDMANTVTPSFVLTSKDVIEAFETELQNKGLSEYLSVSTNLDQVESATDSISNVKTFATTFLVITLIIGIIILVVINMINIKDRKYEIGVLRTIGMKKSLLTAQFMVELLIVVMIALIAGTIIGACVSVPTSNMLLESEIESSQEEMQNIQGNFGRGPNSNNQSLNMQNNKPDNMPTNINGVAQLEKVDSINAVVDFKVLLQLLGIGILLTCVSSIASMVSIQRFSPLTILKERS